VKKKIDLSAYTEMDLLDLLEKTTKRINELSAKRDLIKKTIREIRAEKMGQGSLF
jgi:hypothetical protein